MDKTSRRSRDVKYKLRGNELKFPVQHFFIRVHAYFRFFSEFPYRSKTAEHKQKLKGNHLSFPTPCFENYENVKRRDFGVDHTI